MKKIALLVLGLLGVLALIAGYFFLSSQSLNQGLTNPTPEDQRRAEAPLPSPIFSKLASWDQKATWTSPQLVTNQTPKGLKDGYQVTGEVTTQAAAVPHFEDPAYLASLGFEPAKDLAADGPGSSTWGYQNASTGQTVLFSYRTEPTSSNPDEPLQFACPCQAELTVFVTTPSGSS